MLAKYGMEARQRIGHCRLPGGQRAVQAIPYGQSHCLDPPVWDQRAFLIGEFVWRDESDGFEQRSAQESRELGWGICHVHEPS
jgi:hypothetical protein